MKLKPAENMALTIARGQIEREEPLGANVAAVLALALIAHLDAQPDPGAVAHLLTGPLPPDLADLLDASEPVVAGCRLLVTVWGNGSGEVSFREADDPHLRWGAPAALTPAP